MANVITCKIDVKKIDKAKLFNAESGAVYLDVVLIPTPDNKYGSTHMIVQSISKEEREAGKKGAILGNGKELDGQPKQVAQVVDAVPEPDDLPF